MVVIIDEYDAPLHQFISDPSDSVLRNGMTYVLSAFYGVLRSLSKQLRLVYITGILKYSQMFSTLNNMIDHTFDFRSNAVCGYTEQR